MRRNWLSSVTVGGVFGVSAMLGFQLTSAATENEQVVEVIKKAGRFVFKEAEVEIKVGQSIKWVARDANVPHQFVSTDNDPGFKEVEEFESPKTPTQKFEKAGAFKYHCIIHPNTMKGTITVK